MMLLIGKPSCLSNLLKKISQLAFPVSISLISLLYCPYLKYYKTSGITLNPQKLLLYQINEKNSQTTLTIDDLYSKDQLFVLESGAAVCEFFLKNNCIRGSYCPFRHTKGEKTIVCKHWLRGLCKKGDQCEFLHEYDMSKMPECYFYTKFGK